MTHNQYISLRQAKTEGREPEIPCAAWHLTFGGRCLNCGYDPALHAQPGEPDHTMYVKRQTTA